MQVFVTTNWQRKASCRGTDSSIFFSEQQEQKIKALKICSTCPVKSECLEYAISNELTKGRIGIFGGKTPRQRRIIYDKRLQALKQNREPSRE